MSSRLKIVLGLLIAGAAVIAAAVPFSGAGAASNHSPLGRLDAAGLRSDLHISARGWAFDPDNPVAMEAVDLYVDNHWMARAYNTGLRPDVQRRVPGSASKSGFAFATPNAVGYGDHNVCAFAINVGAGHGNPLLGCITVGRWDAKHPRPAAAPAPVNKGAQIAALARAQVGRPYVFGGTSPAGFDCSGLAYYVYRQNGIALNRDAQAQYNQARALSQSAARPGDLIFFHDGSGYVYHVAVFEGGNMMVAAADYGEGVKYQGIWSSAVTFGTLTH